MSEPDKTTRKEARVLLLPATLRRGGNAGASYRPRLRPACGAWQPACGAWRGGGDRNVRADEFRGRLYTSWADGIAARWQRRFVRGARPGFIFALRPFGAIERWVQSPLVNQHQHAHTSLVSTQFNLRVSPPTAPIVERHLRATMLQRTLAADGHTPPRAPAGASGRATSLSSVAASIEQRYRRVTMPETSAHARDVSRREVAPPSTDFVFRREAQASEPGRATPGRGEPSPARPAQTDPRTSPDNARPTPPQVAAPRLDVDVLTEQVMQRMQRRLTAQRERMGRV